MYATHKDFLDLNNKYLGPEHQGLLSEAKTMLSRGDSLSEVALLLEAAIQKGDLGTGGYEAWILLGETRNMDEREDAGMRALVEGVRRAKAAGDPSSGMLVRSLNIIPTFVFPTHVLSLWPSPTQTRISTEHRISCFCAGSEPNTLLIQSLMRQLILSLIMRCGTHTSV